MRALLYALLVCVDGGRNVPSHSIATIGVQDGAAYAEVFAARYETTAGRMNTRRGSTTMGISYLS